MIGKETLAQIILDFQEKDLPPLVERELEVNLKIPLKRATTIIGPRRCGKTYYLYSLIKKLLNKYADKSQILYINFEDPKLIEATVDDLLKLMDKFYELFPQNKKKEIWLFFDEIQNIEKWEIFIRKLLDQEQCNIFITGSSSRLLSKEIATSLRGRTLTYKLLPFSFREYLKAMKIPGKRDMSSSERTVLLNALEKYFIYGGYPETVIYPQEFTKIIREIIEVTIYRDLIERYSIRNIKLVKMMLNYLIRSKEFSVHQFYNFLKSLNIKVSKNSLYNYLEYFNDALIVFPVRKFSPSLKKQEQSLPKIYLVDNSLIELIYGDEKGKKLENIVFLSLLNRGLEPNREIFYYKVNNHEIDFVIKQREKFLLLIQVCYDVSDYQTLDREVKSFIKAEKELNCKNLLVITYNHEEIKQIKGQKIKFVPLDKWLLTKDSYL